jgi:hypothetical protein
MLFHWPALLFCRHHIIDSRRTILSLVGRALSVGKFEVVVPWWMNFKYTTKI